MTRTSTLSVALLTNAPAPYRTPLFNELSKRCRFLVSFDTSRESDRQWVVDQGEFEFPWVLTRAVSVPRRRTGDDFERRALHVPLNVVPLLSRFQPDVVVSLELGVRTAAAAAYSRIHGRPLIIWWEGTPHSEDGTTALKTTLRRVLSQRATRAWGNGEESARSLATYGVPRSRIDLGMNGMDTVRWRSEVDEARETTRISTRQGLGLRGFVLLFVGQLTARKGIRELLAALSILALDDDLPAWSVLFVGTGPLASEVEAWANAHPTVPVSMAGFVEQASLAKHFAAADLFVMPSLQDVWGLVCLEALLAGIPQVTSPLAGAATLVTGSEVGSIVDPREARSLADHLSSRIRGGAHRVPEPLRAQAMTTWSAADFAERAMSSISCAARTGLEGQRTTS